MEENDQPPASHQVCSYLVLGDAVVTACEQPPAAATPQFQINIKFSGEVHFSDFVVHQDSTEQEFVSTIHRPLVETSVLLDLPQFLSLAQARETIDRQIKENWPVADGIRHDVVDHALKKAREAIVSMPARHNTVHLDMVVAVIYRHVFDERRSPSIDDGEIEEPMDVDDDEEVPMVPAEESSIESLERRIILVADSVEICSICLEEFSRGRGVICMPCSHVFDENCINKWLRISNNCPICRFKLPAASC